MLDRFYVSRSILPRVPSYESTQPITPTYLSDYMSVLVDLRFSNSGALPQRIWHSDARILHGALGSSHGRTSSAGLQRVGLALYRRHRLAFKHSSGLHLHR